MAAEATRDTLRQIAESLRSYLETLKDSGVGSLPGHAVAEQLVLVRPLPEQAAPVALAPEPMMKKAEAVAMPTQTQDMFVASQLQSVNTLEALRAGIGDCRRCKLCQGRTNIVFGVGSPQAEVMFVGEGPGHDEDLKGEPFVGRAGQLLTDIITKGMKMTREEIYIANVVKCRPPENRNPEPDEVAACQPFLLKQIDIIKPRVLVALGTYAAQTLLQVKTPISRLRGVWYSYHGVKLMPTFHPAYLLRNPNDKRLVWLDIQAVLREMGRL
ncbi:MAG: uracil-DNA glycosylase [Deltaproteobacteria bacterium]|nr:uracil-DNA glycosylase [Deltaproteobacteria bacterium]